MLLLCLFFLLSSGQTVFDPCKCILQPKCDVPVNEDPIVADSIAATFAKFLDFDDLFDAQGFITPDQWKALGLFDIDSSTLVVGPFPDGKAGHLLVPGAFEVFGAQDTADTASAFYAALVNDPNFPNHAPANPFDAPKSFHTLLRATGYDGPDRVLLQSFEQIRYCGFGIPSDRRCPVIFEIHVASSRRIRCDCDKNVLPMTSVEASFTGRWVN